jgi:hypothetical protein
MVSVKDDMRIKAVSVEMTSDRREWKKTCCADPTYWDKGRMMIRRSAPILRYKLHDNVNQVYNDNLASNVAKRQ